LKSSPEVRKHDTTILVGPALCPKADLPAGKIRRSAARNVDFGRIWAAREVTATLRLDIASAGD